MLRVVTCLFNPCRYRRLWDNYDRFRDVLAAPLTTVELSYDGRFHVADALQIVGDPERHTLWQKERLLNLALDALPPDVDRVAWVDADVLFPGPEWTELAGEALERHAVVQLFESVDLLDDRGESGTVHAGYVAEVARSGVPPRGVAHPGFAWAARRDALPSGLFDADVVGGADTAMLHAWLGYDPPGQRALRSPGWQRAVDAWSAEAGPVVRGRLGHLPLAVRHLWHGDRRHRLYRERTRWLSDHDYDPATDVRVDESGLWTWASHKPAMHAALRRYFELRQDDGPATVPSA